MLNFIKRRWLLLTCFALAAGVGVWLYDNCFVMLWVGFTDLKVEFVVTDADTGRPIEGAEIEITVGGVGLQNQDGQADQFKLITNHLGLADRVYEGTMSSGARSSLGFTNTFGCRLPDWTYTVSAPGYNKIEVGYFDPKTIGEVRRTEPGKSRVEVPISLHRSTQ